RRTAAHRAMDADHGAVRLYRLAVLEQEVLAAGIRSHGLDNERRVRRRCRTEAVHVARRDRGERHPAELVERPRVHARWGQPCRVVTTAHQPVLADPLRAAVRAVEVRPPEPVARFVSYRADGHDLRDIAPGDPAQTALQDVVPHLAELARAIRVGIARHEGALAILPDE